MRQVLMVFVLSTTASLAQTGRITGTLTDGSGTPIAGGMVMASLRSSPAPIPWTPGRPPAFMSVRANAASTEKGEFQIDGLLVGTYVLCVETSHGAYLNPCLWTDQPVRVEMAEDARVSGVSVVAPKGANVTIRVQDIQGLLVADPANDDLRVGAYNGRSPFIPARVISRDGNGKTLSLAVPRGKAANIAISSSAFALADEKGKAFGAGEAQIPVPSSSIDSIPADVGAPTPTVTVQVTGRKGK